MVFVRRRTSSCCFHRSRAGRRSCRKIPSPRTAKPGNQSLGGNESWAPGPTASGGTFREKLGHSPINGIPKWRAADSVSGGGRLEDGSFCPDGFRVVGDRAAPAEQA